MNFYADYVRNKLNAAISSMSSQPANKKSSLN